MKLRTSRHIEHPRQLVETDRGSNHRLHRDGREFIDLASNDYLGLSRDPRLVSAAQHAIERFGTGAAASPVITGHSPVHIELVNTIARFKRTDSALIFPCGYSANLATITSIVGPEDVILCDRLAHASLIDGCRLSGATTRFFRHGDTAQLATLLARYDQQTHIITEGLFSMDGTICPIAETLRLAESHGSTLIIDEAHSNGVYGEQGAGVLTGDRVPASVRVLHVGTLSKAFASQGGFVATDEVSCRQVMNLGRSFLFSTSLAPACVAAATCAIRCLENEPELATRLRRRASQLRNQLASQGWAILGDQESPIISVVTGSAETAMQLAQELEKSGILAPAIRPPTVKAGTERVRLSVNAHVGDEEIERVAETLASLREHLDR